MKKSPQQKRFCEITKPLVTFAYEGCDLVRGILNTQVEKEDARWTDKVIDTMKATVQNPKALDQYKKVKTRTVFELFFEKHAQNWDLFRMPLRTTEDRRKFDKTVYDIIQFRNRNDVSPNYFPISIEREHGEQAGITYLLKDEPARVYEPPFKFSIQIELVLSKMEF